MAEGDETRSGTYRCPVCGHRDSTNLAEGRESLLLPCTYCETLLEITARGPDSIRFQVQVAEEEAP